jgi:hypothetical protein
VQRASGARIFLVICAALCLRIQSLHMVWMRLAPTHKHLPAHRNLMKSCAAVFYEGVLSGPHPAIRSLRYRRHRSSLSFAASWKAT